MNDERLLAYELEGVHHSIFIMTKPMENSPRIFITADGSHSMFSQEHGVSYHSKHGAIQETQHVFIDAAYHFKLPHQQQFSILEIGFGTGLNAFMTWLESEKTNHQIQYTAVEAFPISMEEAKKLNYYNSLQQDFSKFLKLHESPWEEAIPLSDNFLFTKNKKRFEELEFKNEFDIIYFDAFAPNAQPELWDEKILQKMYDALKTNGVLTTYCAKGVVKRTLKAIGFKVEAIPGPPGKREMTRAIKQ